MFDFFYSKTRYRQYRQLNDSLSVLGRTWLARLRLGELFSLPAAVQILDGYLASRLARQIASGIPGQEYLIYDENGGFITLDLSDILPSAKFSVLFDPMTGLEQSGGRVTAGAFRTLTSPFAGDSVLLLAIVGSATPSDTDTYVPFN
jgi:hypothetical protein